MERVLAAYHAALQENRPEKVLQTLGESYIIADETSAAGPDRFSAHLYLTGKALRSWPREYLAEAGPHRNQFRVVSFSVRGEAAILITRDTGRNKFRSWKDEEVAWFFGRTSGRWRIVAMIIRDIQLPSRP